MLIIQESLDELLLRDNINWIPSRGIRIRDHPDLNLISNNETPLSQTIR